MNKKFYYKQFDYQCDSFFSPSSSADDGEVPLREKEKKVRPFSMFDTVDQSAAPPAFGTLRKNQSSEDILRDAQVLENIPVLRFNGNSVYIFFFFLEERKYYVRERKKQNLSGRLENTTAFCYFKFCCLSIFVVSHRTGT